MKKAAAFESPLIGHARMRALYRGLVEARALSARMAPGLGLPRGLEACWVATAVDLCEGDLVSGKQASEWAAALRELGLRTGSQAPKKKDLRPLLTASAKPFSGTEADRLFCAAGAAMALQQGAGASIAIVYTEAGALKAADWLRFACIAAEASLPLLLVLLPGARPSPASLHPLSRQAGLPLIPVDAADAVALYRVAQESLGRARAGGGPAAIECVASGADPIPLLASQLVGKAICSQRWTDAIEPALNKLLPAPARRTRTA